jgi:hypothetical protein
MGCLTNPDFYNFSVTEDNSSAPVLLKAKDILKSLGTGGKNLSLLGIGNTLHCRAQMEPNHSIKTNLFFIFFFGCGFAFKGVFLFIGGFFIFAFLYGQAKIFNGFTQIGTYIAQAFGSKQYEDNGQYN